MDNKPYEGKEMEKPPKWYRVPITVEPPMFFYMMAYMVTSVVEQSFYVHKACTVNHNYSEEICDNLSNYTAIQKEVQLTTSTFHQWNGVATHGVPIILALFLGAWSDKRGRKSLLLAGFIGKLYFSVMTTINTTQKDWPLEYMIYTAALPSAITGADLAIFAGCFAYISDVSTIHDRTLRVGILDVVYLSTMPTGVALGNLLFNKVVKKSYTVMFMINSAFMVVATVYCFLFLEWQTTPEQKSLSTAGVKNPVADFFDVKHIRKTFRTLGKPRQSHGRLYLWFLLISMALYTFQRDERPMMYLYTNKVFGWTTTQFSNFRTYLSAAYVLVMLFGIPLMTKLFKFKDTVIIMLGATAHMCGHLIYAQARTPNLLYVGATAAALGPCVAPLIRSMTSKLLPSAERGVAFAMLSVMENVVGMFASILYSQLYNATLWKDFPTAIFYLTFSTQAIVFLFALIMQVLLKGDTFEKYTDQENKPTYTEENKVFTNIQGLYRPKISPSLTMVGHDGLAEGGSYNKLNMK